MVNVPSTPGVYVIEVPGGPRPIGGVGTSTAAFLGVASRTRNLNEPVACNNWLQFVRAFVEEGDRATDLARAVFGFFANGGTRCYVVNVGEGNGIAGDAKRRTGLACLEPIDEISIVAAPGYTDSGSYDHLLSHCEALGDRVAVLDAPLKVDDTDRLKEMSQNQAPASTEADGEPSTRSRARSGLRPRDSDSGYGAFYFPWLRMHEPAEFGRGIVAVPPSGHVAGIYARVDATRGVHKAPANEVIRGAIGLEYAVTHAEQAELNRKGVNCIRTITNGIRVWGARTLAPEASESRYINVRRLLNFIKESIREGTNWTVFEPNDEMLRQSVVRDVSNFLRMQWRTGALVGSRAEEAFFVKCDAENNPPEAVDNGQLIIDIGLCPSKPAEFVVFQVTQWSGGAQVEEA
ncbi:phage tail sheath family protein [Thiococcus pfennigii]|uniref:phage tail sheath family protein n=1 Tax=Thiococcus pfennigii TaxID=1057 RepID=UPI001907289C|nr:phage tail sheath C-terminal domain-containing protein [Thiococcus pfennigii]MBK1699982.1 phage tail protein [Thiococcus pfennigii]MBK1730892.1 phage tail protein [Thiococcus pfennigii]